MSYILEKPYTDKEYADFVVLHNANNHRRIEETDSAVYALEVNEIMQNGEPIVNPNYEQEQAQKERRRLDLLNLTKADVLLALYQDKGLTPDNIKAMLKDNVPALIKFDYASSYYRGDEVVNALGLALGYSTEEMDYLFENKKFPEKPVVLTDTESDSDTDGDSDSGADIDTDVETNNEESEVTE